MSQPLRVVAHLRARPDRTDDLKQLLQGLVEPTRNEPGCRSYELHQNVENPAEFTFVEEWDDEAALGAHFETPHVRRALEKAPDLLAAELDLRKVRKLD